MRYPFGYGLSYATFEYSGLSVDSEGASFTIANTSEVAGATVAQLYVRGPKEGVQRPNRELKGFAKVHLEAGESREVRIDFDRYTFRHFDTAANIWQTESGSWTIMVGVDAEHLPLAASTLIAGTIDPQAVDPMLGAYLNGRVKEATDADMAALFNREVITPGKTTVFGVNDPICAWVDSKGFVARNIARILINRERKIREKTGQPDLNTLFILNMPPRAMSKMTQGVIDPAMVESVVSIANGHTFRGLGGLIVGFFHNRSASKRIAAELRQ